MLTCIGHVHFRPVGRCRLELSASGIYERLHPLDVYAIHAVFYLLASLCSEVAALLDDGLLLTFRALWSLALL